MMLMMMQILLLLCVGADVFAATDLAPSAADVDPIVATAPVATIDPTFAIRDAHAAYVLVPVVVAAPTLAPAPAPAPAPSVSRPSCSLRRWMYNA
jgi:hypothetical protein